MASPQIQFRAIGSLGDEIEQRYSAGGSTYATSGSEIARRDLERYYDMLKRSLPRFSQGEAMLLCDVLNGVISMAYSVPLLWAQVSDALQDGYAEKWEIDGPALVEKLRKLTPFECMAVVDAVERVWNSPTYYIDNMEERLRKVGLVAKG
jgi:hypothetical protein